MRKPNSHKAFRGGGGACNPLIATVSGLLGKLARTGCGFAQKGSEKIRHCEERSDEAISLKLQASVQRNVAIASNRDLREQNTECAVRHCNDVVGAVPIHSNVRFSFFGSFSFFLHHNKKKEMNKKKRDCFATLAMTGRGKRSFAFTLSEVLIVLAVLGVVAAMTIPDLIQDYREKATVTAVKKAYTVLNQAVDMGVANNGPIESWDWGNAGGQASVNVFRENIKPYLRIEKDCGTGTGCWYNGYIKNLNGSNYSSFDKANHLSKVLLADGVSLSLSSWGNSGCHNWKQCGVVCVDVNGRSNPNTFGKDVFCFYVKPEGVIPFGTRTEVNYKLSSCSTTSNSYSGWGCTAWVIKKENMDYLRETVSW